MTNPTPDRLEDLRAEYAQTGMVTSDGAVWLFSQVVVLREQVQRLSAPAAVSVPPPAPQAAARRERYAAAIAEGFRAFDADTTSDAYLDAELLDAVIAAADAEEAVTRADDRAAVLREAADGLAALRPCDECDPGRHDAIERLRRLADEAQQPEPAAKPPVGYSGKGRVWCVACPRPDGEDVPVTVDVLQPYEQCAGCGRDVVDVARAAGDPQPGGPCVAGEQQNETPEAEAPVVAYRSRDSRSLYCTAHAGELFGLSYEPVTAEDLPDGGICTYPDCGRDVLAEPRP